MYTIKEISEILKISSNAVRFYEKKNLITPKRGENSYREFTAEDLSRLQMIVLYRKIGFSIEAISEILERKSDETILDQFAIQYDILNEHIHSMRLIRETMSGCIEKMLNNPEIDDYMIEAMEQTANIIASSDSWEDLWAFDNWADSYDEDIRKFNGGLDFYKNYDEVIQKTASSVKGSKIVEVGIGTGNLARQIIDSSSEKLDYTGIDQSINMLKLSKKKCPELSLRVGTFLKLPLMDNMADTVVTSYAFHHCNDEEKKLAIIELKRVLKKNGRIVITDLMFKNDDARAMYESTCSERIRAELADEFFATVEQMEEIFKSCGFSCKSQQIDDLIWMLIAEC